MSGPTKSPFERLREPFPAELVGKLPKITCRDCLKIPSKVCSEHSKSKCNECDNWITSRHIHVDYVGHGATTDRLLAVDPEWNWEPLGWEGEPWKSWPAFERDRDSGTPIVLWITLVVNGVRRLGVGTCPPGQNEAEKVLIGDALRNAAMRFGVALDLWIKGHSEDDERTTATDERQGPSRRREPGPADRGVTVEDVAAAASAAFAEAASQAPEGKRTLVHERLRHAVVWVATDARTHSLKDCNPAELAGIYARLQTIEDGTVSFTHDALADAGGVTFKAPSGDRTVMWQDFEQTEPQQAQIELPEDGKKAYDDVTRARRQRGSGE